MTARPILSRTADFQLNFARVRSDRGRVDLERTPPIRSIWDRLEKPGAAAAGVLIGLGICMVVLG